MKFLKYVIILIVISCGKDSSENIDSKLLEIDSPQSNISDTENSNVELSPLDLAKSKGYSVFACNTPSYPVKPSQIQFLMVINIIFLDGNLMKDTKVNV